MPTGKGVDWWGTGYNEETTTPNVAAGKRNDYPGKENPAEMGNASEGGRDGIKTPMSVDTASKSTTKASSATKVPKVKGGY